MLTPREARVTACRGLPTHRLTGLLEAVELRPTRRLRFVQVTSAGAGRRSDSPSAGRSGGHLARADPGRRLHLGYRPGGPCSLTPPGAPRFSLRGCGLE